MEILPGRYIAASAVDALWQECSGILQQYHSKNPLHAGIKTAELRQKLCPNTDQAVADALLLQLCREGHIRRVAERFALSDFAIHLTKRQNNIRTKLLQTYAKAGIESPATADVMETFPQNERADAKQVLECMVTGGELVMLTPQICWHHKVYAEACQVAAQHFAENEFLTLGEMRDLLHTSRKYALALLEYYDKNRITKKDGDNRKLTSAEPDWGML